MWINDLPNVESPIWSGLPNNVEKLIKIRECTNTIQNVKMIQGVDDDITAVEDSNT
jgi:hypothetical protein